MRNSRKSACAIAVISAYLTSVSYASEDELGALSLEDLLNIEVVTASRSKEGAKKAPGTIVAIPAFMIKERGYRNLEDVLKDLPGVEVQSASDAQTYNRVTIRGVTANNKFVVLQNGIRVSSATGDEIPISYNFPLYNVQQIEIVFGPASALYGADAFTGVINLITHTDENKVDSRVKYKTGSDSYSYYDFHVAQPLGESAKLFFGGHGHKNDHQNLAKQYPDSYPEQDLVTFDGTTVVAAEDRIYGELPTQSSSLFANLLVNDDFKLGFNRSVFRHSTATGDEPFITDYGQFPEWQTEITNFYSTYHFNISENLSSDIQLNYGEYEVDSRSSFTNIFTAFQHGYKYAFGSEFEVGQQFYWKPWEDSQFILGYVWEEFRATPKTADLPKPYNPDQPGASQNFTYAGTELPIKIFEVGYSSYGLFGQWQQNWNEELSSVIGIRFDDSSTYGDTLNPRAGLVYAPSDDWTMKLLYGQAFLAPSPRRIYEHFGSFAFQRDDGIYQSFFFQVPNLELEPEEMETLELNVNWRVSNSFNLNAVIYQEEADNLIAWVAASPQQPDFIPGGDIAFTQTNDNVGTIEATGLDLTFMYNTGLGGGNLNIWGSYSYIDGDLNAPEGKVGLPFTSEDKYKLGTTFKMDNWFVTTSLQHYGETNGPETGGEFDPDTNPTGLAGLTVDSYTIVNLVTGIDLNAWNLELRVNNLLDEKHFNAGLGGLSQLNAPQETRTFELGVTYSF